MANVRISGSAVAAQNPPSPYAGQLSSRVKPIDVSDSSVNRWSEVTGSLAIAGTVDINLAAVADPDGGNHAFTSVKYLLVETSEPVTLDPAASNGWTALGDVVVNGQAWFINPDGYVVGSSDRVLRLTAGAVAATYRLTIVGNGPA